MNSEKQNQHELECLLMKMVDSSKRLDTADTSRIEELIKGNPERLRFYQAYMEIDVLLESEAAVSFSESALVTEAADQGAKVSILATPHSGAKASSKRSPLATGPGPKANRLRSARIKKQSNIAKWALAGCFLLGLGWFAANRTGNKDAVAHLTATEQVVWKGASTGLEAGDALMANEELVLESGRVYLETTAGVVMAVEGPARFNPLRTGDVSLALGKARVRVPEPVQGFTLHGLDVKITDLGTEFGVEVSDTGQVITEVYEGRVRLEVPGEQPAIPVELSEGWLGEKVPSKRAFRISPFGRSARSITWWDDSQKSVSTILTENPEYYYRFDTSQDGTTRSFVNRSLYTAQLAGDARFVADGPLDSLGRAGHVLQFSGSGSAEIPIGMAVVEQTGAYSIALWVRPDRLSDQNILVATNHLGADREFGPQLRIRPDGKVEHYLYTHPLRRGGQGGDYTQRSQIRIQAGQWSHIAISASSNGEMQLVVNGKQATTPLPVSSRISGEYARLILGVSSGKQRHNAHKADSFEGTMDELAFFSRALSLDQLNEIYQASRPCFAGDSL